MWFIAGAKDTKSTLEIGGRNIDFSDISQKAGFISALSINHSTPESNISLYTIDDSSPDIKRLNEGHSFSLLWEKDEITGIDFSVEDNKRIIIIEATTGEIMADGVDNTLLTIKAMLPDESRIDKDYNEILLVPFISPANFSAYVRVGLLSGQCAKTFSTKEYGIWRIPAGYDFSGQNARIKKDIYAINAIMVI